MKPISHSKTLAALKAVPLFSVLAPQAMERILSSCRTAHYKAQETIFGPMHPAEQFYVVLAGEVKIYKLSPRGDEQILHLYGPGQTFGEAAMWHGGKYPAFAQALADSELLIVSRSGLKSAITSSPELVLALLGGLSAKLREFAQLIEELSLKEVPARLAGVLLAESSRTGSAKFVLRRTKRQLASQIGTIAETLSRALAKLRDEGLIEMDGNRLAILDREALEDLAQNG